MILGYASPVEVGIVLGLVAVAFGLLAVALAPPRREPRRLADSWACECPSVEVRRAPPYDWSLEDGEGASAGTETPPVHERNQPTPG